MIQDNEHKVCLNKNRSLNENLFLARYMTKQIGFFKNFQREIVTNIADKLFVTEYEKGDVIMWEGSPGTDCHIIYRG